MSTVKITLVPVVAASVSPALALSTNPLYVSARSVVCSGSKHVRTLLLDVDDRAVDICAVCWSSRCPSSICRLWSASSSSVACCCRCRYELTDCHCVRRCHSTVYRVCIRVHHARRVVNQRTVQSWAVRVELINVMNASATKSDNILRL